MAKNMQPIAKRCKALGISPAVMGYAKKETKRNPGGQMRKKKSEYAIQLNEKQKVKFVYGILEKQFRMYYEKASAMSGKTGENLLTLVERRLDNVIYRLGFAMTRREARQLVNHAHFTVNGKKVNIPSYLCLLYTSGRRVCENCGASYHIVNIPPKKEGVCDVCGGKLVQRKDDNPETVRDRLAVYHKETEPLKGFYEARGILKTVEDQPTVAGTTQAILEALGR